MRREGVIGILVLAMLIAAVPLLRGQDAAAPAGRAVQQWEHHIVEMNDLVAGIDDDAEETRAIEAHFNELGEEGWELVQIHLRVAAFKRPKR